MMLQPTKEEIELYERAKHTTDKAEQEKIAKRLAEIAKEEFDKVKDLPFYD